MEVRLSNVTATSAQARLPDGRNIFIKRLQIGKRKCEDFQTFRQAFKIWTKYFRESEYEAFWTYVSFFRDKFWPTFFVNVAIDGGQVVGDKVIGGKVVGASSYSFKPEYGVLMGNLIAVEGGEYRNIGISRALIDYRERQVLLSGLGGTLNYTMSEIDISPLEEHLETKARLDFHTVGTRVRLPLLPMTEADVTMAPSGLLLPNGQQKTLITGPQAKPALNPSTDAQPSLSRAQPLVYIMPDMTAYSEDPACGQAEDWLFFAIRPHLPNNEIATSVKGSEIVTLLEFYYLNYLQKECAFAADQMTQYFVQTLNFNFRAYHLDIPLDADRQAVLNRCSRSPAFDATFPLDLPRNWYRRPVETGEILPVK